MKILHVSNASGDRCGVAEYGRMCVEALRTAGHDVTDWDGHYPAIYEKPYLPADADRYDWIHVNWHPVTLNHYAPAHFPPQARLSLFLHDLPPWSTCPLWDRAQVRFAAEAYPGTIHLPYPAVAGAARSATVAPTTTIGWSGIRGDGRQALIDLAERRGWSLNLSEAWLGTRDEIVRLSQSTVNVLWYHHSGRGQSLALMTAAAAGRPLLISGSAMFQTAWAYPDEIYRAGHSPAPPYLEPAIDAVLDDVRKGRARIPRRIVEDHAWAQAVAQLEAVWRR